MSGEKQIEEMYADIVEIFDEEYGKRNLITPQNTAKKLTDKGYRKASDLAEEIFAEIENKLQANMSGEFRGDSIEWFDYFDLHLAEDIAELKKYTEGEG